MPPPAGPRRGCASRKLPARRGLLPASAPPPRSPERRVIGLAMPSLSGRVTAPVSDRPETRSGIRARGAAAEGIVLPCSLQLARGSARSSSKAAPRAAGLPGCTLAAAWEAETASLAPRWGEGEVDEPHTHTAPLQPRGALPSPGGARTRPCSRCARDTPPPGTRKLHPKSKERTVRAVPGAGLPIPRWESCPGGSRGGRRESTCWKLCHHHCKYCVLLFPSPQGLHPAACRACLFAKGATPGRRPRGELFPQGIPAAQPRGLGGLDAQDPDPQPLTPVGGEVWLLSGAAQGHWTAGSQAAAAAGAMPVGGLLPLFSSPVGGGLGGGLGGGGGGRKGSGPTAFRLTEKFVLLLVFSAFITLCFGAIFFLPDSSKLLSGVLFHSSPALQSDAEHKPGPGGHAEEAAEGRAGRGEEGAPGDPAAALEDNLARIRENHERALREAKETLQKLPEEIQRDILLEKEKVAQDQLRDKTAFRRLPPVAFVPPVGAVGREPADAAIREKRAKIKEVSVLC